MAKDFLPTIKAGVKHIRNHPQLWWTVIVAIVILVSFSFLAFRFIGIAGDAQDKLVNVRIGSIQDAYAEFIPLHQNDPSLIRKTILNITTANPTIQDFKVTQIESGKNIIIASLNNFEVGNELSSKLSFLTNLSNGDPGSSFTLPEGDSERVFHTARAYTDENGQVLGYIVTTQTLSEADQRIDSEIQNSFLIFIFIVVIVMFLFLRHARIIDYVSLYKQLKEVDELKDDFISMASHELRTPLTVIRGYAEFVGNDKEIGEESKENVRRIDMAAQQLDGLVADMLDVSRIEQGRMKFEFVDSDPRSTVKEVVDSLMIPAKNKGLALSFEPEKSSAISVDLKRLKQVLVNIIGNSVKYTTKGEVKVRLYVEGGSQIIRVSDTGIGMDADAQKNLFQKFYRIKTTETEGIQGTGLGLWITKQIVEKMNGVITVESIKGVGTHFILKFPVRKGSEGKAEVVVPEDKKV